MPFLLHSSPPPLASLSLPHHSPSPCNSRRTLFFAGVLTERRLSSCRRYLRAIPISDQELLQVLTESSGVNGEARTHLPAVRSYETDLARLTLVGSVGFDQALIAAAADGGDAAEEHLAVGASTMVVETVFPGGSDDHSTVSTRLFLPAQMVKKKARKLKNSLAANLLYSKDTLSKNILAMTFRQVVLQSLWSFQFSLFCPGTVRNMEDLESTREVLADFVLSSSDEKFISSLAEVVSSCALESTKNNHIRGAGRLPPNNTYHWFQKPGNTSSTDSSISISRVPESEIAKDARNQVETYKLVRGKSVNRVKTQKYDWWLPPDLSMLDMIGGPGFGSWTTEFIPMYRLQIDSSTFKDVKFEGWHRLVDNRWEVLLTHYQMVELANILDMYFEDRYTIPNKRLSFDLVTETHIILKSKNASWKLLFSVLASGCAIMIFGILARLFWLKQATKASQLKDIHSLSEVNCFHLNSLESTKMEALCISIIRRVKDELGWPEDVMVNKNIGVWTGALPNYFRNRGFMMDAFSSEVPPNSFDANLPSHAVLSPSDGASLATSDHEFQKIGQDIASYQVVMTTDGKLIGFQPTSRLAVNHWSSNPLAKSLYGAQKLSPGFFEPMLNIPRPSDAIPIELLMSINPESRFALARPMQ